LKSSADSSAELSLNSYDLSKEFVKQRLKCALETRLLITPPH